MKNKIFLLFCICTIAFWLFSCAPSPEDTHGIYNDSSNHIILGFLNGLVLPFSAAGKTIGFNIGLYHAGKCNLSYWVGYIVALSIYFRIVRFLVLSWWDCRKQ
ncbi:MAG TPA: hypothetical protein DER09_02230 [Prolixibacteraceae bacterium]|nr:hypothetical protein [Prolixibacteraceae bacterium]